MSRNVVSWVRAPKIVRRITLVRVLFCFCSNITTPNFWRNAKADFMFSGNSGEKRMETCKRCIYSSTKAASQTIEMLMP